jgi:hypothetical protein
MSRTTWQRMVLITHVILESSKPFAEVQAALEALLPPLDTKLPELTIYFADVSAPRRLLFPVCKHPRWRDARSTSRSTDERSV